VSLGAGPGAGLTAGRPVEIVGGGVAISGRDSSATAGDGVDCAPGSERPAIHTETAASSLFSLFGDVTFDRLKAHAGVVLSDSTLTYPVHPSLVPVGKRCDADDPSNWGEPRRTEASAVPACRRYFPIVYAAGPRLTIAAGGRGQGVLLVEGDLEITGDFDFWGLVVVQGGIKIFGSRVRITGALMAADLSPDDRNRLGGDTTIQFSSCTLKEALAGAAFAEPLGQRSWVQVY
jgi:hypothetical protein